MIDRETTKGMTDVEFVVSIYEGLLRIPTEYLKDFFEKTGILMQNELSEAGHEYFDAIKDYVINRRMKEAHN